MISQVGVNNVVPQDLMPQMPQIKEEKVVSARIQGIMREKLEAPVFVAFKILDTLDLKTNSVESMTKDKTLVFIKYENGSIKSVGMHSKTLELMDKQNVTEMALCLPNIRAVS